VAEVTVKQLAQVVGTPIDKLLEQLSDAGIAKAGEADMISDSEKLTLLTHLRESRGQAGAGGSSKKITLKRKRVSELKTDASGRRKVNVEVRSKRTYVRPGEEPEAEAETPIAQPEIESAEIDTAPETREESVSEPAVEQVEATDEASERAARQAIEDAAAAVEAAAAAAASSEAGQVEEIASTSTLDPALEAERHSGSGGPGICRTGGSYTCAVT